MAVAAIAAVYVLLSPSSGVDTDPPECYSSFGYVVPCADGLWVGVALVAAVASGAIVSGVTRPVRSSRLSRTLATVGGAVILVCLVMAVFLPI